MELLSVHLAEMDIMLDQQLLLAVSNVLRTQQRS